MSDRDVKPLNSPQAKPLTVLAKEVDAIRWAEAVLDGRHDPCEGDPNDWHPSMQRSVHRASARSILALAEAVTTDAPRTSEDVDPDPNGPSNRSGGGDVAHLINSLRTLNIFATGKAVRVDPGVGTMGARAADLIEQLQRGVQALQDQIAAERKQHALIARNVGLDGDLDYMAKQACENVAVTIEASHAQNFPRDETTFSFELSNGATVRVSTPGVMLPEWITSLTNVLTGGVELFLESRKRQDIESVVGEGEPPAEDEL